MRRYNRGQRVYRAGNAQQITRFAEAGAAFRRQSINNSEIMSSIQRPPRGNATHREGSTCQGREAVKINRFGPQVCASWEAAPGVQSQGGS